MILMIDNYDSFTYNLVALFQKAGKSVAVKYNDDPYLIQNNLADYEAIIISPGPQEPQQAGYIVKIIQDYYQQMPILGICLGHQAIGQAFGEKIVRAVKMYHGKVDPIYHLEDPLFDQVEEVFQAVRYHSLIVEAPLKGKTLIPLAYSKSDHTIMAMKHRNYPVYGLQFHPESYETKAGELMINQFIEIMDKKQMEKMATQMLMGEMAEDQAIEYLKMINEKGIGEQALLSFSKALKSCSSIDAVKIEGLTDTCGTGGDQLHTFNISTTQSLVLAACGLPIAKHGNRSVSSSCGSADVLEALGVQINLSPKQAIKVLKETQVVFLFAQSVHPKMKNVMPIRKKIQGPTVFNTIGPLSNPLELDHQVIGVYKESLMQPMLSAMQQLGVKKPLVIHGYGGMDELSLEGPNKIGRLKEGQLVFESLNPSDYGFKVYPNTALKGGDAKLNSQLVMQVLEGQEGPYLESVVLNAGLALYDFKDLATLEEGFDMARQAILSGQALHKLNQLIKVSQEVTQ